MSNDMADIRATVVENNTDKLGDFLPNPYNTVRDTDKQKIEILPDGTVQLKEDLEVPTEYRTKFNEFLTKLIDIEKDIDGVIKWVFKAVRSFVVSPKNNKSYPGKHVVLDGNTRLDILNQLIELVGSENVDFSFSYEIYKEWNEISSLLAAPDMGYNSAIPVMKKSADTVLDTAYNYILANPTVMEEDQTPIDWVKNNVVATKGKLGVHKTIFSFWKKLQENPEWLVVKDLANLEMLYYLIGYQTQLMEMPEFCAFYSVEGEQAKEKAFEVIIEELKDFTTNIRSRLTTRKNLQSLKDSIEAIFINNSSELFTIEGEVTQKEDDTEVLGVDGVPVESANGKKAVSLADVAQSQEKSEDEILDSIIEECHESMDILANTGMNSLDEQEKDALYGHLVALEKVMKRINKILFPAKQTTEETKEETTEQASV